MSLKSLSANKVPKFIKTKLLNKRINKLYQLFEENFNVNNKFAVAVSGGPDSLALAFFTKVYSAKYGLNAKYFIVDHKLRKESTDEAKKVKKTLYNHLSINSEILTWRGNKTSFTTQSQSRQKRYELLFAKCKTYKIKNLILGHHIDDKLENFFIRMIRGSGLKGLISFDKNTKIEQVNLVRPLIEFQKKDLMYISSNIFNFFVNDPSNNNPKYFRTKIRKLIYDFQINGLSKEKLLLTVKNLKRSNEAISYYVQQNKKTNSFYNIKKNELVINKDFFDHPYEIVFRSFSDSIKLIGKKYSPSRGKKLDHIIQKIKKNSLVKVTLGGCVIKKVHQTVIILKED